MVYPDPTSRPAKTLAPGVHARPFWGERLMLVLVDFEPGAEVPSHQHPHEQAGVVLSGQVAFEIGGQAQVLGPGQTYLIPSGVPHQARAVNGPARVMDVFSPVREDLMNNG